MRLTIQYFFLLLLILELINLSIGQRVTNTRRRPSSSRTRNRNRNRKGKDDPGTWCYTCFADFEKIPFSVFHTPNYIYNNFCYNPALNYTVTDNEYLTKCSSTTRYCVVDITRL